MPAKKRVVRAARKRISTKVTKDILIGELIRRYPQSSEILLKYGFHCIGCMVSPHESLEAGAAVHGISREQIVNMVKEINAAIQ